MSYEDTTTRAEHLEWCKARARQYIEAGDYDEAFASMVSDLNKHEGTRGHVGAELGMMLRMGLGEWNRQTITDHIEGYN